MKRDLDMYIKWWRHHLGEESLECWIVNILRKLQISLPDEAVGSLEDVHDEFSEDEDALIQKYQAYLPNGPYFTVVEDGVIFGRKINTEIDIPLDMHPFADDLFIDG